MSDASRVEAAGSIGFDVIANHRTTFNRKYIYDEAYPTAKLPTPPVVK